MRTRLSSPCTVALLALACARSAPAVHGPIELAANEDIPVLFRTPQTPYVDCPGDFGVDTWKREAELWESVQAQRTASLRKSPPVDPAGATADRFLLLARASQGLPAFREGPLPAGSGDPRALSSRFGSTPVLLLETTRWVLVGCFFTYQPWYNVRATLLEPTSGRVLWRDTCGGLYPPADLRADATPAELEANGKELYAQMMGARAGRCAGELLARFEQGLRAGGDARGTAPR